MLTHPSAPLMDRKQPALPGWGGLIGIQLTFNKRGAFLPVAPGSVSPSMMIRLQQSHLASCLMRNATIAA